MLPSSLQLTISRVHVQPRQQGLQLLQVARAAMQHQPSTAKLHPYSLL